MKHCSHCYHTDPPRQCLFLAETKNQNYYRIHKYEHDQYLNYFHLPQWLVLNRQRIGRQKHQIDLLQLPHRYLAPIVSKFQIGVYKPLHVLNDFHFHHLDLRLLLLLYRQKIKRQSDQTNHLRLHHLYLDLIDLLNLNH